MSIAEFFSQFFKDTMAQTLATIGTLAASAIFALLNCFFGYKLKRVWIILVGFTCGLLCGMAPCLLWLKTDAAPGIAFTVGMVVGILFGLLANRLYKAGVFLFVGILTFAAVSGLFPEKWMPAGIIVGIVCGVAVGILSLRYLRSVCIFSTAISGGLLASQNFLRLFNVTNILIVLAVGAAIAVAGAVAQFKLTGKRGRGDD